MLNIQKPIRSNLKCWSIIKKYEFWYGGLRWEMSQQIFETNFSLLNLPYNIGIYPPKQHMQILYPPNHRTLQKVYLYDTSST